MHDKWLLCALVFCALPSGPAQAQNGDTPVIASVNGENVRLLGFVATGPQPDLDRLLTATAATPFLGKLLPPPDGPEVMVLFKPGSDPKAALEFYARVRSAEFSALKINAVTYPLGK